MARIRSIKPEFWTSEQVMECSPNARLLFIGMWNFADDHGRLCFSAKMLKAQIYPGDDFDASTIRRMIDELIKVGLVVTYTVNNKEYLFITGWRHQKIDRPRSARHPAPPEHLLANNRRPVDECSSTDHRTIDDPSSIDDDLKGGEEERKGGELKGKDLPPSAAGDLEFDPADSPEEEFWKLAAQLSEKGIARSRAGQLLKLNNGDSRAALSQLRDAARANHPSSYLGKIITNLKAEQAPVLTVVGGDPGEPEVVREYRRDGYPVEVRTNGTWKVGGYIYDRTGQVVGF